jgi:glycosyltransferase involved in cell wall biosynthesis
MDGVQVHRFRYAPSRLEVLAYTGGMLAGVHGHPWRWMLVPLFLFAQVLAIRRLVAHLHVDIVHAHWLVPQGVGASLALPNARSPALVCTGHGADLFALRSRSLGRLKCWVVGRCSLVTVVSSVMADEINRLAPHCKAVVAPMGVDFHGLFTPGPTQDRRPGEILFVGRLVEKKGIRHLIAAMPAILGHLPGARLTVVGSGPEEAYLRNLVQERGLDGYVDFVGARSPAELPAFYRRASIFVAPFVTAADGDREGLGLVTIEAIACGCPVLVGDTPAVNDILDPGEADLCLDPRHTDLLAARILAILREPEAACRRALAIRERLAKRLSWEAVAEVYAGLLQGLIPGQAATSDR